MIKIFQLGYDGTLFHPVEDNIELFRMPGGEWHVKTGGEELSGIYAALVFGASADDLLALAVLSDAVARDGGALGAGIPYLPAARQDKREPGEALSAKVYAELINSFDLDCVVSLDPHSLVSPAELVRHRTMDLGRIVSDALWSFRGGTRLDLVGVIAPDAGAEKRASIVARALGLPTFQALKKRDPQTGKLSGFTCEPLPETGRFLVVDDICDGGGTFKGLADSLKIGKERLDLWVTHGVFSAGSETLSVYFDRVMTTNSHPGGGPTPALTYDITEPLLETIRKEMVR